MNKPTKKEKALAVWKQLYQVYQDEPKGKKKDNARRQEMIAWGELVDAAWEEFQEARKRENK
jgi:hypothetical protein